MEKVTSLIQSGYFQINSVEFFLMDESCYFLLCSAFLKMLPITFFMYKFNGTL